MATELAFGHVVRQRRRTLDLTQEELARRVGCAAVTIRKIEAGDMRASQQIAERLAVALGVPPDERAAFVRSARSVVPGPRGPAPTPRTPALAADEIGVEDLSGRAIRGYQLGERLGMGGFGAVYRAVQPLVEREVAVKIILPRYADHPDFIRRFEAEAQLVARLEHPAIVPLYDYWREPGVAYLVMRYLRGGTLHALLQQGVPPLATALRLVEQIGAALYAAHRTGVIHRDLKPANILLDEDQNAYVADFGIAKDFTRPSAELSFAGAFVGSPAYTSPEQIRAEPVSPQTDIYALGVLLYELLTGRRPFEGPTPGAYLQQHLTAAMPNLAEQRAGLPVLLDRVVKRATAKVPGARYPDVRELLAELRVAAGDSAIVEVPPQLRAAGAAPPTQVLDLLDADNPYKGLRPFDEADAADFFGRETLIQQLLARIGEGGELARFLAVIGPSGSGKSSVVRAGLIPALRAGALQGSEQWYVVGMLPGIQPLHAIAAALRSVAPAGSTADDLLALLRADNRGLLRTARLVLPPDESELVLVIDQFEELFTLAQDEAARTHVLDSIVTAVLDERSRVRVIVTLRADFVDRPLQYVDFGELLRQRSELVLPLTAEELERAVSGPARRAGLALEEGLAASIIAEAGGQPGILPLLQHSLSELFMGRQGRALTRAAYMASGGLAGSLARSAETIYAALGEEARATARELFLRLIAPGEGGEDTRRRVRRAELAAAGSPAAVDHVIEAYGRSRLLTFDHDPAQREPTVEVAHEALLREWPRLRGWVEGAREALRTRRRLAQAAAEWSGSGEDPSYLAAGMRLAQFAALGEEGVLRLAAEERAYLAASLSARAAQEQAERERVERELAAAQQLAVSEATRAEQQQHAAMRLRRRAYGLAGALAAALVLATLALYFGVSAERNARSAEDASRLATSRELAAAALSNLEVDPERSMLLALRALEVEQTRQAGDALHRAVLASRVQRVFPVEIPEQSFATNALFSPDGTLGVASAFNFTSPLTTTIFDTATGAVRYQIPGFSLSFRWPEGRYLLTEDAAAENLTLTLWETSSTAARAVRRIELPVPFAESFSYDMSADRALIAVSRQDRPVVVYSVDDAGEVFVTADRDTQLHNPTFSPDGAYLAVSTTDFQIKIWRRTPGGAGGRDSFSPAYGTDERPLSGPTVQINFLTFSPDGSRIAAVSGDGTVSVWNLSSPLGGGGPLAEGQTDSRLRFTLRGHTNDARFAAWSPDGARLATSSQDRKIIIWDMGSGARQLTLAGHTASVGLINFSSDGTRLISGSDDNTVRIWDVTPAHELRAFAVSPATSTNYMLPMALSRDGRRLIAGNPEVTAPVQIFDATSGDLLVELPNGDDRTSGVALSADGSRAATASAGFDGQPRSAEPAVAVWDGATGELVRRFPYAPGFIAVALSPDGTRVAATAFDATVHLWDVATGQERILANSGETVEDWPISFSPDGTRIAASAFPGGGHAAWIDLWDVAGGQHLLRLEPHADRIFSLAFDSDGARLASVSRDGTAKIWDLRSGALLQTMEGHTSTVMGVAWSPDDTQIATTAYDSTIRLWDVASGDELRSFASPSGSSDVAFSADGKLLYASGVDGIARVYLRDVEDLIALARTRLTRGFTDEECAIYLHSDSCPASPAPAKH